MEGQNANEMSWQDNATAGRGWSYGVEMLIQKKSGKLSGWAAYTLSWTRWNFPEVNSGQTFFPRHDRRHNISLVGIYELSKRITLSATWVYGTGNALTLPVSAYKAVMERFMGVAIGNDAHWVNTETTEYSGRSNFRAEPFHRMDVAIQFHKQKKRFERTWEQDTALILKMNWQDIPNDTNYYRVRAFAKIEYSTPDPGITEKRTQNDFDFSWDEESGRAEWQSDRNLDGSLFSSPTGKVFMPTLSPIQTPNGIPKPFYSKCRLIAVAMMVYNSDVNYFKYHRSLQQRLDTENPLPNRPLPTTT